jgi:glutaredoxin-related protein
MNILIDLNLKSAFEWMLIPQYVLQGEFKGKINYQLIGKMVTNQVLKTLVSDAQVFLTET